MPTILNAIELQKAEYLEFNKFMDEPRNEGTNRLAYYNMLQEIIHIINNHGQGEIDITYDRLWQKMGFIACCDKLFVKHLEGIKGFNVGEMDNVEKASYVFGKLVVEEYDKKKGGD